MLQRIHLRLMSFACYLLLLAPTLGRAQTDNSLVNFNQDVRPILQDRCFRCHGPDEATREAGLRLDDRDAAVAESDSGLRAIVPHDVATSELLVRVESDDDDMRMPPDGAGERLSIEEINTLRAWVEQGASYQQHWAFVKPQAEPPRRTHSQNEWVRNPIDAFVLQSLSEHDLVPAGEADRYVWIRRLSIDLIGLPPTLGEVDQFVNDSRPDAYERLVDRLLQSPAFGERWGRVWLDLARYADSAGYAQDPPRVIWRYRDWVIDALNRNLPFDQFSIEQLAGDLLTEPTDDQVLATAFHRNTMTNSEGGTDDEEFRTAAVVDRVNTTMQVWMGLTMGCAQCHTHKYDPITQEEYFQFFAVFNNTADADRGDEAPTLREYSTKEEQQREMLQSEIETLQLELDRRREALAESDAAPSESMDIRFIRVESLLEKAFLSLAEVQAFVGERNVATDGVAHQISDAFGGSASRAIDGDEDGDFSKESTTHTQSENQPWWELDLGSQQPVDAIVVWNRTDNGNQERLKRFRVVALDQNRKPVFVRSIADTPRPSLRVELPQQVKDLSQADRDEVAAYLESNRPEFTDLREQIAELKKRRKAIKGVLTPIMRELPADQQRKTHVQIRGDFLQPGVEVQAGVPEAFHPLPDSATPNRLEVSKWLVADDNPLTARVTVNRCWEQLFGVGLVETSEDFGTQGEPPSHPRLLDYLAVRYAEQGWDTKQLLRQIVTSATYRQSSAVSPRKLEIDPRNRLLSRGPSFRLSAEMIRDQALAIGGLLSRKLHGESVRPPRPVLGLRSAFGGSTDWQPSSGEDRFRRGIYTSWRRTTPYPSMTTFDAPSREVCTIRRVRTNTPLQALVTLNDPVFIEAAQGLAHRMVEGASTPKERIVYGFRLCVARPPSELEVARLADLFQSIRDRYADDPSEAEKIAAEPPGATPLGIPSQDLAAWTVLANVLLNLDELLAKK